MIHPFTESLQNIELKLEKLTKLVTLKQERFFDKPIIDNDELQQLFSISSGTAKNWRESGIIGFIIIRGKIYYRMEDVNFMLNDNYKQVKKKL